MTSSNLLIVGIVQEISHIVWYVCVCLKTNIIVAQTMIDLGPPAAAFVNRNVGTVHSNSWSVLQLTKLLEIYLIAIQGYVTVFM